MAAPAKPRRGRPLNPLDPDASSAAALGAELRVLRLAKGLTLQGLGDLTGYTPQYVSEVERAKTPPAQPFVAACDRALEAHGALLALLPAALHERDRERQERAAARRAASDLASLGCEAHSDAGEDVDPTNRRGLIGAAGAALVGLSGAAPASAREVDPELPAHLAGLLRLLGRHDATFGPHDVLALVKRELRGIAAYRQVARGALRTDLLRAEACWTEFAAWLSNDTGRLRDRDTYTERALQLARAADEPDTVAVAWMRQGQWAIQEHDAHRAIACEEAALRVSGASAQTRARCELRAALSYSLADDADACERHLDRAYGLADDSASTEWAPAATSIEVRAVEARCWTQLRPSKAIPLYESVLCDWPRGRMRDGGLQRARLALACAAAGELDRARVEGRRALAIFRQTQSATAASELKRLQAALAAA